jgi:Predicted dehydrogenases and related proteins
MTGLRVGVIGAGRMGGMRARVLADDRRVTEVLIADRDSDRAQALEAPGITAVADVDALFAKSPDAVVVSTATDEHAELVQRCVSASIPCFCEKPLALELSDNRALRDLVRRTGARVQVGFHRRFDPELIEARGAARSGRLGELRRVHLISADAEPPPPGFITGSGGIFRDLSIHDFDTVRWLTGREILSVYATGSDNGDPETSAAGDVRNAVCALTLEGGLVATVHASRDNGGGYDVRLELAGTRATIAVGLDDRTPLLPAAADPVVGSGRPWSGFLDRFESAYARETAAFVDFVTGDRDTPCGVDDAVEAMCVAVAADRSLRTGKAVSVGEVRAGDDA